MPVDRKTQSKRHRLVDRGDDLYETPPEAIRSLLAIEKLPKLIWEPACGPGAIVRELRTAGHAVIATDLVDYGCPKSGAGFDFLTLRRAPQDVRYVVTNPPYKHATAFARKALDLVPNVALLMRLAFMEGTRRSDVLDSGRLRRVHVFSRRLPMMHRAGWTGPKAASAVAFAWFVWDGSKGHSAFDRIDWATIASAPPASTHATSRSSYPRKI